MEKMTPQKPFFHCKNDPANPVAYCKNDPTNPIATVKLTPHQVQGAWCVKMQKNDALGLSQYLCLC